MTRTIAISVFKGGTGKTTTAVNLAAALSLLGKKVLLVNTDTQPQCSQALGVTPNGGLAQFVDNPSSMEAVMEVRPNLYFLAGGAALAQTKSEIAKRPFGGEKVISDALAVFDNEVDYTIIDTGPGFDSLSIGALFTAHEIVSPIIMEVLAVNGLLDFISQLKLIQEHHPIQLKYVLPTSLDKRVSQTDEILTQLQGHFGEAMCEPIRYNVRLSEAAGHGQHIFEYSPKSKGAQDYATLTERILADE